MSMDPTSMRRKAIAAATRCAGAAGKWFLIGFGSVWRSNVAPSDVAGFGRLVQRLNECRDALDRHVDPSSRPTIAGGVIVQPQPDDPRQVVRDAAQIMAALNAARHRVPPQQVRACYEAAAGYARALQRHTNNQGYVDRTIRAAEHGLRVLDEWERNRRKGSLRG